MLIYRINYLQIKIKKRLKKLTLEKLTQKVKTGEVNTGEVNTGKLNTKNAQMNVMHHQVNIQV